MSADDDLNRIIELKNALTPLVAQYQAAETDEDRDEVNDRMQPIVEEMRTYTDPH